MRKLLQDLTLFEDTFRFIVPFSLKLHASRFIQPTLLFSFPLSPGSIDDENQKILAAETGSARSSDTLCPNYRIASAVSSRIVLPFLSNRAWEHRHNPTDYRIKRRSVFRNGKDARDPSYNFRTASPASFWNSTFGALITRARARTCSENFLLVRHTVFFFPPSCATYSAVRREITTRRVTWPIRRSIYIILHKTGIFISRARAIFRQFTRH